MAKRLIALNQQGCYLREPQGSSIPMESLRDDDLSKETGIPGCVFVHMSDFIGGNHTYVGALAMARGGLKL
ncbi:hypothetical protein L1987_09961 [Smallanthus sonchifolius]|uniref:Uncharacterized protein n=1 Tax=Smallanthus sonchifolius TaxID=185202 RepID=A0ACB9JQS8_9ASTR|nr:hypothetical protein L1987_09961 [Smallanthus sonchifolius]